MKSPRFDCCLLVLEVEKSWMENFKSIFLCKIVETVRFVDFRFEETLYGRIGGIRSCFEELGRRCQSWTEKFQATWPREKIFSYLYKVPVWNSRITFPRKQTLENRVALTLVSENVKRLSEESLCISLWRNRWNSNWRLIVSRKGGMSTNLKQKEPRKHPFSAWKASVI